MSARPSAAPEALEAAALLPAIAGFVAGGLATVGVFLEWVTVRAPLGQLGIKGTEFRDGKIALAVTVTGLVALAVAYASRLRTFLVVSGACGIATTVLAVYEAQDIHRAVSGVAPSDYVQVTIGGGLYLVGVGGVAIVGAAIWAAAPLSRRAK